MGLQDALELPIPFTLNPKPGFSGPQLEPRTQTVIEGLPNLFLVLHHPKTSSNDHNLMQPAYL